MKTIYMDYNATTPVAAEVFQTMLPYLRDNFGNPSSNHILGKVNRAAWIRPGCSWQRC